MYNLRSSDVWDLGASPEVLPWIRQCPALQPNPKVKITQQAVRDSGFVTKTQQRLDLQ